MFYFLINVSFLIVLLIPIALFFLTLINITGEEIRKTAKYKNAERAELNESQKVVRKFKVMK